MSGRESETESIAYYARLRREAETFIGGAGRGGGDDLYREIERAVARHLTHRDTLPGSDERNRQLLKRAGRGSDGFSPQAGWDLLHDFVVDYLFNPGDAKISSPFSRGVTWPVSDTGYGNSCDATLGSACATTNPCACATVCSKASPAASGAWA